MPTNKPEVVLPEQDLSKNKNEQGLFRKYEVRRTDGSDFPGGKHDGCDYFVLDMTHDPHAKAAASAYADSAEKDYPDLAADMCVRYGLDTLTRPADGEYDRELIACMLQDFRRGRLDTYKTESVEVQIALLREADNRDAAGVHTANLSAAPQQHGQEVGEVESIGRAFLSVLGDPSIAWRNTGAHEFIERVSQATARQKSATPQQPAEAVAGEYHECPHCKGWSRTTPTAIDIGKLRELVEVLNHAIATQLGARVTIHATRARQIRDELAALIGDGGEAEHGRS